MKTTMAGTVQSNQQNQGAMPHTATSPYALMQVHMPLSSLRVVKPWWRLILEWSLYVSTAIVVLEVLFNVANVGNQELLMPDATLGCKHIAGKRVTWRMEGFSNDLISSAGLRDVEHPLSKPQGVTRIALLGDSATEGVQVPLEDTYSRVLESSLNQKGANKQKFEVINFGTSSYSTGQELLQYRHMVRDYKPDVVAVLWCCGDVIENTLDPMKFELKRRPTADLRPYFYFDEAGKLQMDSSVMQSNAEKFRPHPVLDFLRAHSRIYGVLTQTNLALMINENGYRKVQSWFNRNFAPRREWKTLPPKYDTQDKMAVTTELIKQFNQEVTRDGSKFLLLVFPNNVRSDLLTKQADTLKKLSQSQGFELLDLTQSFHHHPQENTLFLDYHFSSAGHKRAAETIEPVVRRLSATSGTYK